MMHYAPRRNQRMDAPRSPVAFWCDAVKRSSDPTGTIDIRRRYSGIAKQRFFKLRTLLRTAIVEHDVLGLNPGSTAPLALAGSTGSRELMFQTWLDNLLKTIVVQGGEWLLPMLEGSYNRALKRAMRLTRSNALPTDKGETITALATLCLVELQGIAEAVSQRVMRAVIQGWLHNEKPVQVFTNVSEAISVVGVTRSNAMVELMTVKTFSTATLDQFQAANVKRAGLIAEARVLGKKRTDARTVFCDSLAPTRPGRDTPNPRYDGGIKDAVQYLDLKIPHEDFQALTPVSVPLADLKSPQRDVEKLKVDLLVANWDAEHLQPIYVIQLVTGDRVIWGGNHRVLAALARGDIAIPARVLTIAPRAYRDSVWVFDSYREHLDAPRSSNFTGPGARIGTAAFRATGEAPSRSTVYRIRAVQAKLEAESDFVNVQTAGDEDVCPECEDIENDNPYSIDEARSLIPAHPRCRCAFVPIDPGEEDSVFGKTAPDFGEWFSSAGDRLMVRDYNENHDPETGEFSEGEGGGVASLRSKLGEGSGRTLSSSLKVINAVEMVHMTSAENVASIEKNGFSLSNNSMYGKGVYFSNEAAYSPRAGMASLKVELTPHLQLQVERDTDVGRATKALIGKDQFSSGWREAMIEAGVKSIRFPVDEQIYTMVLDPSLIKIKKISGDHRTVVDYNENHDPDNGEFTSGEGGGSGGKVSEGAKPVLTSARVLTGREQYAVDEYTANGYNYVNMTLRSKEGFDKLAPASKETVKLLDGLIKHQTLTNDAVVYRGVPGARFAKSLKDGAVLTDKGFMSTASEVNGVTRAMRDTGVRGAISILEIALPSGTNAYAPQNGRGESEVLLARGSRIEITGRKQVGENEYITARYV